jgi:rhodanese-related sulfurtransferase
MQRLQREVVAQVTHFENRTEDREILVQVLLQERHKLLDVIAEHEAESRDLAAKLLRAGRERDTLQNNLAKISKNKPVITCCASGMRSASAKGILQNNGF